jgi:hypothetical protein
VEVVKLGTISVVDILFAGSMLKIVVELIIEVKQR